MLLVRFLRSPIRHVFEVSGGGMWFMQNLPSIVVLAVEDGMLDDGRAIFAGRCGILADGCVILNDGCGILAG
jgi:hypothetical protein